MAAKKTYTEVLSLMAALMFAVGFSCAAAVPSHAAIKNLELSVDTDGIDSWTPGIAFFPDIELEDEDGDMLVFEADTSDMGNSNPTMGKTVHFALEASDEILDDDLKVTGNAIRATYVDSVSTDNMSASGRLLVYPFYQLTEPEVSIDFEEGLLTWSAVDYAGDYEVVITYINGNGTEKTVHSKTGKLEKDISGYINQGENGIGAAVRALATDEEGYMDADVDYSGKEASWETISGVEKYKVVITYTNSKGEAVKKTQTVTGNSMHVGSYIAASADGAITVKVRGVPTSNEAAYYNIAPSEWGYAEEGTADADTSDYDLDYVWSLLGDYTSVTDADFASVSNPMGAYCVTDSESAFEGSSWVRTGYRWQYFYGGEAYAGGWIEIGGSWYYFDSTGYMHMGWLEDDGKWYYLETVIGADCGKMVTGTHEINGREYVFDANGACTNKEQGAG